jgi:thioredoxin reductase (NADPH)
VPFQLTGLIGDQKSLHAVQVRDFNGNSKDLNADVFLACYGLSQNLGPISDWGLEIENRRIETNPTTAQTNQPGLFAIGDIAVYPQKQRLILTGFSEAAFAAEAAYRHINPDIPKIFQHSTTKGMPQND